MKFFYGGYMLARTPVVYSICSLQTYTLYLVSLITNNLCFITVLFICQINHYNTIPYQYNNAVDHSLS